MTKTKSDSLKLILTRLVAELDKLGIKPTTPRKKKAPHILVNAFDIQVVLNHMAEAGHLLEDAARKFQRERAIAREMKKLGGKPVSLSAMQSDESLPQELRNLFTDIGRAASKSSDKPFKLVLTDHARKDIAKLGLPKPKK